MTISGIFMDAPGAIMDLLASELDIGHPSLPLGEADLGQQAS